MFLEVGMIFFVEDAACTVFLCFALVLAGWIQVITRECLSLHIQGMGKHISSSSELGENMGW